MPAAKLNPVAAAPAGGAAAGCIDGDLHLSDAYQLRHVGTGHCPICGMSTELLVPEGTGDDSDAESRAMTRRLWLAATLTLPLLLMAMHAILPFDLGAWADGAFGELGWPRAQTVSAAAALQALLATLVVAGAGGPLLALGWRSFVTRQLNVFSLVTLGVATAWSFSLYALLWPRRLPAAFVAANGPPLYFEAAAVIVTLVLLGQVLETRARVRTNAAIRGLLRLAANVALRVGADGRDEAVALSAVVVGDTLRVKPGGKVPVDGVVLEGDTTIDESMINGESAPAAKSPGSPVTGATLNQAGAFTMRADKVGAATLLARIVALVAEAGRTRAPPAAGRPGGALVRVVRAVRRGAGRHRVGPRRPGAGAGERAAGGRVRADRGL